MNMQKTNLLNRIIGIVGLIISVILIINFSDLVVFLIDLGEKYLSRDNNIVPKTIFMIKISSVMVVLLIGTISIIFFLNFTKKMYILILTFFQVNNPLTSNLCRKKHLDFFILVISTILGFFLIYHVLLFGEPVGEIGNFRSEGMLEMIFAFLLLFSIIILISSITRVKSKIYSTRMRRKIIYLIIVISGILFMVFGEELSWGQMIFNLDSFGIFNEYNYQNETNVHNFLPPSILIKYIYPTVGLGSFLVLFLLWLIPKKRESYFFNLFFPHPSLFFLVLMMTVLSFFGGGGETYENLFTIFVLLYSFRIYMCLTFPNVDLLSKKT